MLTKEKGIRTNFFYPGQMCPDVYVCALTLRQFPSLSTQTFGNFTKCADTSDGMTLRGDFSPQMRKET